ncbi:hypothetical protein B0H13DRAFT_1509951, partial [Mycena leptocephala]
VTVMELHHRLGHIAPDTARKHVEKGYITGVRLDVWSGEPTFCDQVERASEVGEEIHSDLLGPAPNISLGGRRYYATFTD